jgi:hypothetical protein
LIEALALGGGETAPVLDGEMFLLLQQVLPFLVEDEADETAAALLCGWDLSACEALDEAPRPGSLKVPPNLIVELAQDAPREFTAGWIRLAARLDPERLVAESARLASRKELLPALAPALAAVGTAEAVTAVAHLAKKDCLSAGPPSLQALAEMGASSALLELAASELPLGCRQEALRVLAGAYPGVYFPELSTLARSSPEPSLRRSAFSHLSTCDPELAAADIRSAVDDLQLRDAALAWLRRLPGPIAARLSLELLPHAAAEVRQEAIQVLSRGCPRGLLRPLFLDLLSPRKELRRAALAVLEAQEYDLVEDYWQRCAALLGRWEVAAHDRLRRLPKAMEGTLRACKHALTR